MCVVMVYTFNYTSSNIRTGQCTNDNGATGALGALLAILLLVVVGLLVVIGILAIKVRRNTHKCTGRSTIQKHTYHVHQVIM